MTAGSTRTTSDRIVLARRPHGQVRPDDFRRERVELPAVGAGDVQLETLYVSIDPAIRGWLDDRPGYLPPVAVGEPVRSLGLARVTASRHNGFAEGDLVRGFVGWQERQVVHGPDTGWDRVAPRPGVGLEHHLGVLGMTGLTAWAGVCDILRPEPGQTVLVSGASGAVGSIAVQLARIAGARVVGISGGARRCAFVAGLGAEAVVDRTAPDWPEQLRAAVPDGVDRLFENSGGPVFDRSIAHLNDHARIALCGLIDGYNLPERPAGPATFGLLLTRRVRTQGFIVLDYADRAVEVAEHLGGLVADGALEAAQTLLPGFGQLPRAFVDSFGPDRPGERLGKTVVDLSGGAS